MIIKTSEERDTLIEAGKRLARVLEELRRMVVPGVGTADLDDKAEQLIREGGDVPAFLGYMPEGARRPYPATLCVSINDEVVHGIPNEVSKIVKDGDIVSLDIGLAHHGIIVDSAVTVPVGNVAERTLDLIAATEKALNAGISHAAPGKNVGDISHAIQTIIEQEGFTVVRDLGGHSVGERVHEDPFIANFGKPGTGEVLVEGMVLALEPIASMGKASLTLAPDGYTYRTKDGSLAAHSEHTILIEKNGARIITA
jgi:methionyl aminopeptidase